MTLRILHVNKRYPPHIGGVETVVRDLAREQASRAGVEVDVLVVSPGREILEWDGPVRVLRVSGVGEIGSNPLSTGILRELRRSARGGAGRAGRHRPLHDVWHFHYPFPTGELSLVLERRLDGRQVRGRGGPLMVATYHSDVVPQTKVKRLLARPYERLTERYLQALDAVIVSSPQVRDHSRMLAPVTAKTGVIPFGIDPGPLRATPTIEAEASRLRDGYGLPLTLFVGRLVPYKGVEVLLRAFRHVPGHLVVVGEGPLRGRLEALADESGVGGRVSFVGSLSRESLTAHFCAADLFVLPSVTPNEAFGLVQLEAHACGVPVVSTRLPSGVPFVNADGETGLVVEPGDPVELAAAMALLLEDEALRRDLGRRARERFAAEFSLRVMGDRVLSLYDDLLGGRGPAG